MTLFVTGSESFIGKALVAQCTELGLPLTGIDTAIPADNRFTQGDICDPQVADAIPQGVTVIHLAAISRDPDCRANPRAATRVNVEGTLNMLQAARSRGARQFIFASSEWVYGDVRNDEVQVENQSIDAMAMKSEYAISKLAAEQLLRLGASGMPVTILRFGIVYGPRDGNWSAVESLCHQVYSGQDVKVGSVRTARRFIHVADIVSGILASRGRDDVETFNLSGDQLITLAEIVSATSTLTGRSPRLTETDPAKYSIRNPDNSRARMALKWAPRIDLNDGLKSLIAHFAKAKAA
ncbi:MAG: NAD(P)-dependent oxidoreductase [Alphaproteobacteria bacterium]|nr:NAD(P)-dependent oxidoreductase [Alphaproteobacteria bacterium]